MDKPIGVAEDSGTRRIGGTKPSGPAAAAARWGLSLLCFPLLNAFLNKLIVGTSLPLFLDSIFTVLSAALFGLGPGLATAVLTNGSIEALTGFPGVHIPFALCGMATAAIVARAVGRGRFHSPLDLALVTLELSLANAVIGATVAVFAFGGFTDVNVDVIVSGFATAFGNILSAAFLARLPVNIVDKGIAILVTLLVLHLADRRSAAQAGKAGAPD
jgi:energy-coupling factor transport system substrate-specific component